MNESEEFQRYMSVEKMNEMDRNTALYEAREEGLNQGVMQGMLRKSVEMAKSLYALKVSIETIAKAANLTVGEVESIINS